MRPSPWNWTQLNPKPPCGAKSTLTTNQTPAPLTSPVTPPRITSPLPPSEPQQNAKATLSHPLSSSGRQTIPLTPITLTASDKEQTTLPYAHVPTLPTHNLPHHTHTGHTGTPKNMSCSTAHTTPRPDKHTSMVSCHSTSSSAQKKIRPDSVPSPLPQSARSSVRSTTWLPGWTLREFLLFLNIPPLTII